MRLADGDYKHAIADFTVAVLVDTSYAEAYMYRGLAKLAMGNVQAALDDFNKAIANKPEYTGGVVSPWNGIYQVGEYVRSNR
ncbi:hypothetical protein MASR2M18_21960 [Ignavibacteria bacterium]